MHLPWVNVVAVSSENMEESRRVVVVSGVPDVLPVTRMADKLQKHFQSSRNDGGDVEDVKYPTHLNGVAFVTFDHAEDAERVVQKKYHILGGKEFPEECPLTVFHFTPHVSFYVTNAIVNLSEFSGDQEELIQSLQEAHRSVRIQPVPRERRATAEGPFEAIRALRVDLISRASVQCGAEQDVEGTVEKNGSIRSDKHSPGERSETEEGSETEVRDNISSTHAIADDNSASHAMPDADSKLPLPKSVYDVSVTSSYQQNVNKRHKTNEPVTAKPFAHSPENTLESSKNDTAVTGRPDPIGAGDPAAFSQRGMENLHKESIWVDSNTFSYIQRFDMSVFNRRVREHSMSLRCEEGSDLTCVTLSGRPNTEVQSALRHLQSLVEYWQTTLRVHVIVFESVGSPERQWVFKVCDDVNTRFSNVLYTVEASCIRVIGPSTSSYLFSKLAKEKFAEVDRTYV